MVVLRNGIQKNLFQPFILMEKRALLHQTLFWSETKRKPLSQSINCTEIVSTDYRPVAELVSCKKGVQKKTK
jgi:hypothetical protein